MKKISKILFLLVLIISFMLVNVYAINSSNSKNNSSLNEEIYSKKFLEWMELPEEVRNSTIPPLTVNVNYEEENDDFPILSSEVIPTKYDLRSKISVEVKNQMTTNQCWAFSANSTVETYLALRNETYNFSERHLEYATQQNFSDGVHYSDLVQGRRMLGVGGSSLSAFQYYAKASGPIMEEDMPFEENENLIRYEDLPKNNTVKKVEDMLFFPSIYKNYNGNEVVYLNADGDNIDISVVNSIRNEVKSHIMKNGAVTTDIYAPNMENDKYYNSSTYASFNVFTDNSSPNAYSNHSVTIIGWDDNYSKSNFKAVNGRTPSNNGAWIVLNSWGENWGDKGVYYISYEDYLVEAQMRGILKVSDVDFDNVYMYDTHELVFSNSYKYAANVFTSKKNEVLTKITIGSLFTSTVNVYVNPNGGDLKTSSLTKVASNVELTRGYKTIELEKEINLSADTKFAIIVEVVDGDWGVGLEKNIGSYITTVESHPNESFYSTNGSNWYDLYNSNDMMNYSIKAFTKTSENKAQMVQFKLPNKVLFKSTGGVISAKVKTTTSYEGKNVSVSIYNSSNTNVSSSFSISASKVKSNLSDIKITVPKGLDVETYNVKVSIDGVEVLQQSFKISSDTIDTSKYVRIKFTDANLYWALKNSVLENDKLYAYFDSTQELVIDKSVGYIELEEKFTDSNGNVYLPQKGYNVVSLDGLEKLPNLYYLNVSYNPIRSLKPLASMPKLTKFHLYRVDVNNPYSTGTSYTLSDINVLSGMTQLEDLTITNANISDISFVSNLTNLMSLDLQVNNISNITYLRNLTDLQSLILDHNNIRDISVLSNLSNINRLSLSDNPITDISAIKNLKMEYGLDLFSNNIRNPEILDEMEIKGGYTYIPNQSVSYVTSERQNVKISNALKKTLDSGSRLYSSEGLELEGCVWSSYGNTFNFDSGSNKCEISVLSGNHHSSTYTYTYVEAAKISGIKIITTPSKTTVGVGMDLSYDGGVVRVSFTDGTSKDIDMTDSLLTISGFDSNNVGSQTITVSYGGYSDTFTVVVVSTELTMSLKSNPSKLTYFQGEDLNLTGGKVTIKLGDGTSKDVDMTDSKISVLGYNKNGMGEMKLRVIYTDGGVTLETSFTVTVYKNISKLEISDIPNCNFTGSKLTPSITIVDGDYTLVSGVDYKVTYANNQYPGVATVTIKGGSSYYAGNVTKTFNIVVSPITGLKQSALSTNSVTISWNKNTKLTGYEVYYSTSKNGTYKKAATITKNNTVSFKLTGLTAGKTYYFKVRGYVTYNNKKYYDSYVLLETTSKPAKVTMKTPTTKSSKVTLKWNKVSNVKGYVIYYSTSKNGTYTKLATITKNGTVSYKTPNLKKGKKYYFKMRSYKNFNGIVYYGDYSAVKSIKVK